MMLSNSNNSYTFFSLSTFCKDKKFSIDSYETSCIHIIPKDSINNFFNSFVRNEINNFELPVKELLDIDFSNINPIDDVKTNSDINNEDIDFSNINPIDEIIINSDRNNEDIEEELFDDLKNIFKEKFIKNEIIESSEKNNIINSIEILQNINGAHIDSRFDEYNNQIDYLNYKNELGTQTLRREMKGTENYSEKTNTENIGKIIPRNTEYFFEQSLFSFKNDMPISNLNENVQSKVKTLLLDFSKEELNDKSFFSSKNNISKKNISKKKIKKKNTLNNLVLNDIGLNDKSPNLFAYKIKKNENKSILNNNKDTNKKKNLRALKNEKRLNNYISKNKLNRKLFLSFLNNGKGVTIRKEIDKLKVRELDFRTKKYNKIYNINELFEFICLFYQLIYRNKDFQNLKKICFFVQNLLLMIKNKVIFLKILNYFLKMQNKIEKLKHIYF